MHKVGQKRSVLSKAAAIWAKKGRFYAFLAKPHPLNVKLGVFRVGFNKLAPGRHLIAHQHGKHLIGI